MNGEVSAPTIGHKKARWPAGLKERFKMAASLFGKEKIINPAMDIPLRKAHGSEYVRVTPEIAQHWLTFNTANREVTQAKLEQYKSDMLGGYWNDDGATVCFSYGKLIDGQHRLMALVLAGVTLRLLIVHGLDSEVQVTKDTGRGRSARDVLSIEGLDSWSSRTMGAAVHTIIAYETGRTLYSSVKFTNREVRNYYLEHQSRLDSSIKFCKALPRKNPLLSHSFTLAMHYIFSKKDAEAASRFFDGLMVGADLSKTSPVFYCRKLLDADMKDGKRRSTYEQMFFVVRAWNSFRRGGTLRATSGLYPRDGEQFPEIA